jgi:hypothetical protein
MTFSDDVKRFAAKAREAAEKIVRETEIELYSGVILQTPVDTGRARGNWFYETGSESTQVTDEGDKSGSGTVADMRADAQSASFPRKSFLTNNLPYAIPLEEGHSGQAPAGMVRVNAKRADAVVRAKIREHKV